MPLYNFQFYGAHGAPYVDGSLPPPPNGNSINMPIQMQARYAIGRFQRCAGLLLACGARNDGWFYANMPAKIM
jgi:hypothetical protein